MGSPDQPEDAAVSAFAYLDTCHTSVVGIREKFLEQGCHVACVSESDITLLPEDAAALDTGEQSFRLLAYPAQVARSSA